MKSVPMLYPKYNEIFYPQNISVILLINDGDKYFYDLDSDITGSRSRAYFGDVTTLYQLRQSTFYRRFADVGAGIQDFLFRDFSNRLVNHCTDSLRLGKRAFFQILHTAFKLIVCFQRNAKIIFYERFVAVLIFMPPG